MGPQQGSLPSQIARRHVHACCARNDPSQTVPWLRCVSARQGCRGYSRPLQQCEEGRRSDAMRVTRLRPGRKFSHLGKLATDLGWGYMDVVTQYEEKRKEKNAEWYAKKKGEVAALAKAKASVA